MNTISIKHEPCLAASARLIIFYMQSQQPHSVYQLKIVSTEIVSDVAYYQIQVLNTATRMSWSFRERYRNMYTLHGTLAQTLKRDLPAFPAKKMFGNTDPEFVSTRKAALQNYFKILLGMVDVDSVEPLKTFLTKGEAKAVREQKEEIRQSESPQTQVQQQINVQKQKQQDLQQQRNALRQRLQQACEKAKSNFIDLNQMMGTPEEADIKRKRVIYDQVKVQGGQVHIETPKGNPQAKTLIFESTYTIKSVDIEKLTDEICAKIDRILTLAE